MSYKDFQITVFPLNMINGKCFLLTEIPQDTNYGVNSFNHYSQAKQLGLFGLIKYINFRLVQTRHNKELHLLKATTDNCSTIIQWTQSYIILCSAYPRLLKLNKQISIDLNDFQVTSGKILVFDNNTNFASNPVFLESLSSMTYFN